MALRSSIALLAAGLTAVLLPLTPSFAQSGPEPRISGPIVHENIAVYLVHGPSAPGSVPLTLQEALAKGTVEVIETGNVQELHIRNSGGEPVFIQAGDIVKGGQQDRVLTVSMVVEPRSGLIPIGAFCVEQGRWSARGKEDVKRFALSDALLPSREAKVAIARAAKPADVAASALGAGGNVAAPRQVTPASPTAQLTDEAIRTQRAAALDQAQRRSETQRPGDNTQGEVWRSVSKVQSELSANLSASVAAEASRSSLQLTLEHEKLKAAQAAIVAALEPAASQDDDVIGVAVAVNGRLTSADVYPSNGLFRKMWPKLARAAATEAISAKRKPDGSQATADTGSAPPAIDAVRTFIADAEAGKASERTIGGMIKTEVKDAAAALRVETRTVKGDLVHRNYVAK